MKHETVAFQARDLRKLPDVCHQTGQSAATIYRKIKGGTFPSPVKLGARASAWVGAEIDAWIADRIAERDGPRTLLSPVRMPLAESFHHPGTLQ